MSKWLKQQQLAAARLMFNDIETIPMADLSPTARDKLTEVIDDSIWGIDPAILAEMSEQDVLTL